MRIASIAAPLAGSVNYLGYILIGAALIVAVILIIVRKKQK